jgi:hypothetical protein
VSDAVAVASYENNPASVHPSVSSNWHRQAWRISLGEGPAPPVFKSGRVVIVDPARVSVDLLSELGMGMRLR